MIYGIGMDIVKIDRIKKLTDKYGDRFIRRILSGSEIAILHWNRRYSYIAGRFAAKEAIYKAMGKTYDINFKEIEILNDDNNKPYIGDLNRIEKELNINRNKRLNIHISISHEMDYAISFVVMEII